MPSSTPTPSVLTGHFWFIAKNVIGWLLILSAPVIGIAVPGPGGVPIFLLGFALATIPGKRRMTSHAMRGRPVRVNAGVFVGIVTFFSVAASAGIIWYFEYRREKVINALNLTDDAAGRLVAMIVGLCLLAVAVCWVASRLAVLAMNWMFRTLPKARRLIRPLLRKYGVSFLPPRRKVVGADGAHANENEILSFDESSQQRFRSAGQWLWQWLRRALVVGITLYIFFKIIKPIVLSWSATRQQLDRLTALDLVVSIAMFALFLGGLRAMSWRSILTGFGFRVPRAPALRIWIMSELARYIPGGILQVVSRVRLLKPYGVRGSVCSTSQVLELSVFLLANVCLAVACLLFLGFKNVQGPARQWLLVAIFLVPLLSLILHPRVFYGLTDRILARLGKPPIANRLSMSRLMGLFAVAMLGLLWQSAALWILLHGPLGIGPRDWWILAGAYSLAWTAGFLAFLSPGGLGVREIVLIGALGFALPPAVQGRLADPSTLAALAMLTRLWTIAAEMIVTGVALLLDWRGAVNDPAARGRVRVGTNAGRSTSDSDASPLAHAQRISP